MAWLPYILFQNWKQRLAGWAADGSLATAARHALNLDNDPPLLQELVTQWAAGDFSALPPIVLLPASSMPGAAGAYAISTGTIYLNEDWLQTAKEDRVMSVLSEELGHHLDALWNAVDTPGDEGDVFSRILIKSKEKSNLFRQYIGTIATTEGVFALAEFSAINQPSLIANLGTQRNAEYARRVAADRNGFIYLLGHTDSGMINGVSGNQNANFFIAKYNAQGDEQWTRVGGTEGFDFAIDMSYDGRGSFWILSFYNGTVDRSGYEISRLTENGILSNFKRDSFRIGKDMPSSIAASSDNLYLAGFANYAAGFDDVYVEKYDNYGALTWRATFSTSGRHREEVNNVAVDHEGNVYVAGMTDGGIDGAYANKGYEDIFVLKYSRDGTLLYSQFFGGDKAENLRDMCVSTDGRSIYLAGGTYSSRLFGVNTANATGYIVKLTASGHLDWIRFIGKKVDYSFEARNQVPTSIAIGEDGLIYLSGSYGEKDERGSFLNSYSQAGELVSNTLFGLSGSRFRSGLQVNSIASARTGFIALFGESESPLGERDLFISRLDIKSNPGVITLALSPASVTEDGTANLIYTFSRTGATTSALTVNYTVGGTATLGTDYSGIAATGTTKTVSFVVGSATATVTVNPTADTTIEANETVALTLANGTGYSLGTTTAVVGTITNDDVQAGVSTTLAGDQSTLTLTGTNPINGTGNALDNIITGNTGNNILDGKAGVDTLTGLGGADTFLFSYKPAVFSMSGADHITDFSRTQGDKIKISKSAFGITQSSVSLSVVSGSSAVTTALASSNLFVYDMSNGYLHWNQNGFTSGAGTGGLFAILDNKAGLTAGNILLM